MTRNMQSVADDIVEIKRFVKQKLIGDPDILEALNNPRLSVDSPDDYLDVNIYGMLRIPKTQDVVKNFICITIDDTEVSQVNEVMKVQVLQITIICHLDDLKTPYGIDRHDLLGYLIRDTFNWTNDFGLQFKLICDKEQTVDSDYFGRTLKFQAIKPNSLNKARMDNPNDRRRR